MKLNQLLLLLGVDAVRHRNKKYSDDETFTYKTGMKFIYASLQDSLETRVENVAELSGINEYITMIEEETKAAKKADEILKEKPKKKGRKKHNVSFKYIISGNGQYNLYCISYIFIIEANVFD